MDAAHLILNNLRTSTVNVEFKDLLVFFLGLARRGDQERSGPEPSPESLAEDCVRKIIELQTSKKEAFDEIIHYLQIYATNNGATSRARYAPFVQAFNLALDLLAGLNVPLNSPKEDPLMFYRKDPKEIIDYHEMEEFRREPDVVLGNESHSDGHDDPDTLQRSDTRGLAPQAPPLPFRWSSIKSSVEFKATVGVMKQPLLEYTYSPHLEPVTMPDIPTDIYYEHTTPTSPIICPSTPPTQTQSITVIKRLRSSSQSGRSEGNKVRRLGKCKDAPSSIRQPSSQKEVEETAISNQEPQKYTPIVQCALYGAEMLSKDFLTTHAINILVVNDRLNVWYYDTEGIIQSSGINFMTDLPYFLALLLAFQRFDDSAWGICSAMNQTDGEVTVEMHGPDGKPKLVSTSTEELYHVKRHYGIVGRSTRVLRAKISGDDSGDDFVLKISYPEAFRIGEHDMIIRAREIADNRGYILEHLPECVAWLDLPQYSTSTIRDALKVKGKLNSGRILRITAWKRLRPLTDLVGKELWKAFWECYRCHLHLFKGGLQHSDISDMNLMYNPVTGKGVLNDFDLALDVRAPERSVGHALTGTLPFLSLDLFHSNGKLDTSVQRKYYHDEESFRWALVWIITCYRNGKFEPPVDDPIVEWDHLGSTWFRRTAFLQVATSLEETARNLALPEPDRSIRFSAMIMMKQIKSRGDQEKKAVYEKLQLEGLNDMSASDLLAIARANNRNPSAEELLEAIKEGTEHFEKIPIDMHVK